MNFVHLSTVKFRIGGNLATEPKEPSISAEASCEPDASMMSSHNLCDLPATPSQKLWSMEDLDWLVLVSLYVTISHLRSQRSRLGFILYVAQLTGLHMKCSLGSDYIDVDVKIDCGD